MEFILEMFPFPKEVKHYRPTLSKKEKVKERVATFIEHLFCAKNVRH